MNTSIDIPPHMGEIKKIVTLIAIHPDYSFYLSQAEYQDVLNYYARFLTYTQENLDEDMVNYIKLAKYYRRLKRLVIWGMRQNGLTFDRIGKVFGITKQRARSIYERTDREKRRAAK